MTERPDPPADLPLLEQAAAWLERMAAEGVTDAERRRFDAWRGTSPDHALAFAEVEAAHETAATMADSNEMLALRHETLARMVMRRHAPRRRQAAAAGTAAALLLTIGLASWGGWRQPETELRIAAAAQPIYQTRVGERLSARLEDGSTIILNTGSRLRIAFTPSERRLVLERGQALFEVAKGQKRPFTVLAGEQLITAHGTEFDVRMDGGDAVKVALIEGAVAVRRPSRPELRPIPLRPGELLTASADKMLVSRLAAVEHATSWRDGLIQFDNDSLADAVAEMNRYVRQPIRLADPKLGAIRVSGAFRTGETEAFIEALEIGFGLKVADRTPERILLVSG